VQPLSTKTQAPPLMPAEPIPHLAHFPFSMGQSEPLGFYRNAFARAMRSYVIYWLGELADEHTISEAKAVSLCTYVALGQMERPLRTNEAALLTESVRDVIVAREAAYRHQEWLDDHQGVSVEHTS
jgi:hypothetical protein